MKFEIVNPSDYCTLESDSHEAAAVACTLLGNGVYGLKGIDTDKNCPIFLFGGHDEWFTEEFGDDFSECLGRCQLAVADCLETVALAGERTSMNDIAKAAKAWAKSLRANNHRVNY